MPIHDWTRVNAGTWHSFLVTWIGLINSRLNNGLLPSEYYSQDEQIIGTFGPDVLTLHSSTAPDTNGSIASGTTAVLDTTLPKTRIVLESDASQYSQKRKTIVIRHSSGDRIVAMIEIVSPGNKSSQVELGKFVRKSVESIFQGYHLLVVDLFPPSKRDPQGIQDLIWKEFSDDSIRLPEHEPLTLGSYAAGETKRAFIETVAVGSELTEMPLFLTEEAHIKIPLESTYTQAFRDVPKKWQHVLCE